MNNLRSECSADFLIYLIFMFFLFFFAFLYASETKPPRLRSMTCTTVK